MAKVPPTIVYSDTIPETHKRGQLVTKQASICLEISDADDSIEDDAVFSAAIEVLLDAGISRVTSGISEEMPARESDDAALSPRVESVVRELTTHTIGY